MASRSVGAKQMGEKDSQRRLAAILAMDAAAYSRLMRANEEGTIAAPKEAIANNPARIQARLMLAASNIKLARQDVAAWQADEVPEIKPDFTPHKIERITPIRTDAELGTYKAILLRKADFRQRCRSWNRP